MSTKARKKHTKKQKRLAIIALVAVVGIMAGIWFATRPRPESDSKDTQPQTQAPTGESDPTDPSEDPTQPTFAKNFTVIVVHSDGTEKTFTYGTNADYLGPVLVEKGLIVESDSPGLFNTVDGETADWNVDQSYWSFYIGGEYGMTGVDKTDITEGATYTFKAEGA